MAKPRRYTKAEKVTAILAAEASSVMAAAQETGIPRTTIIEWLDRPEFVILRHNAREAMAEEAGVVARLAWQKLGLAIANGELEGRDLIFAAGTATDKTQLLRGEATSRTETKALTDDLNDTEKQRLRDWIDGLAAATSPEGAPV